MSGLLFKGDFSGALNDEAGASIDRSESKKPEAQRSKAGVKFKKFVVSQILKNVVPSSLINKFKDNYVTSVTSSDNYTGIYASRIAIQDAAQLRSNVNGGLGTLFIANEYKNGYWKF